ncbi:MAG: thrombospondin type 3 repeat-containing protein [Gammaproteobacteria bacterium]|nr:thrombospondin type 3 repeat-containing protein [Gammaproteobacteria bacterium]
MKLTTLFSTMILVSVQAQAADMASANYGISWDVADGGGGLMTSANYVLTDSVGQSSAIGVSSSASFVLQAGFQSPPDSEGDLVKDFMDNCILDPNTDQFDSNADGFGNLCDADINNDSIVNFADLNLLSQAFFANPELPNWNPDADLDNSGLVNFADLSIMSALFFLAPGPSGIAP